VQVSFFDRLLLDQLPLLVLLDQLLVLVLLDQLLVLVLVLLLDQLPVQHLDYQAWQY
jgi:hypothetical protein